MFIFSLPALPAIAQGWETCLPAASQAGLPAEITRLADSARWYQQQNQEGQAARHYRLAGQTCLDFGFLYEAENFFYQSLNLAQQAKAPEQVKLAHKLLGIAAAEKNDYAQALQQFEEYLALSQADGNAIDIAKALNNIGITLKDLACYDLALDYLLAAAHKKDSLEFNIGSTANTLSNLGIVYMEMQNYPTSKRYYQRAYQLRRLNEDYEGQAEVALNLGNVYFEQQRYDSMIFWLRKSQQLVEQVGGAALTERLLYSHFSDFYKVQGNYDSAYYYLYKYDTLNQRLFSEEKASELSQLRVEFETEKKNKELALQKVELEQTRDTMWRLVAALLLVIALALIYYQRQKATRAQYERQETENINIVLRLQEELRNQIGQDLHDRLGATLAATKLFFNAAKASEELSDALLRVDEQLDVMELEIRKIAYTLASDELEEEGLKVALQNWKHKMDRLSSFEIELDTHNIEERLPKNLEVTLYMIFQELINNIMRHAKATEISIMVHRHQDQSVSLMIEDNGVGFVYDPANSKSLGMGMRNIKERAAAYRGEVQIDSTPNRGTTITISIPPNYPRK